MPKNEPVNTFFDDTADNGTGAFVLDFTQAGNADQLIPAGTVVNCSIKSAKASVKDNVIQFAIRFDVEEGDYTGSGFWENAKVLRVVDGRLELYTRIDGENEMWKLKRLLKGINFDGPMQINPRTAEEAIAQLNELGDRIKGSMCAITVSVWGGGEYQGKPSEQRNGIREIKPYGIGPSLDSLL